MASKICTKCKQELTTANFIGVNSQLHSGSLPICRKCLAQIIEDNLENGKSWNIVNKILQWADIQCFAFLPYIRRFVKTT